MEDKILRLGVFVQFDFYTVDEMYCLQLFDKDVCANDGVDCIWESSSKYFNDLFNEAIEWCKERMKELKENEKITGILSTKENNSMSLSCFGEIEIKDNVIRSTYSKGMPRANGIDSWFRYYESASIGENISPLTVQKILDYNGRNNILSTLRRFEE